MENASKALLMAGGILIALLILGSIVLLFANLQDYQKKTDSSTKQSQIAAFNNQFEPYNKDDLTLMELKSLYNKIESNNTKYPEYEIGHNITATFINAKADPLNGDIATNFFANRFSLIPEQEKANRIFECEEIKNEGPDGRISYIKIKDITPDVRSWIDVTQR